MAEAGIKSAIDEMDRIPELNGFGLYFMHYYNDLVSERRYEQGQPLPIPNSIIRALAGHHGLSYEETEEMVEMIRIIDEVHLKQKR